MYIERRDPRTGAVAVEGPSKDVSTTSYPSPYNSNAVRVHIVLKHIP